MKPSFEIQDGYNRSPRGGPNECDGECRWALKDRAREGDRSDQLLKCRRCGAEKHVPDTQHATNSPYHHNALLGE